MGRLSPTSKEKTHLIFRWWMDWLGENGGEFKDYTPDDLVEFQRNASNSDKYKILDLVQDFIQRQRGRYSSKKKYYTVVKSFFLHNRAELPKDASFEIRAEEEKVKALLTIEEVRDMILSSKPVYQAIFLSMFQGGMGQEEFIYWNLNGWKNLEKQLDEGTHPIKVELPGRKKQKHKRPYYTLLGKDSVDAINSWVSHRPKEAEAIFTDQYGNPLSKHGMRTYWKRHLQKIGLIRLTRNGESSTRYGRNLHELRDLFRSQWEKSPAKVSIAEFMMGHQVDPLEYNKAFRDESWVRREYLNAEPLLNIMSSATPYGHVDEDEVRRLNGRIQELETILEQYRAGRSADVEALKMENQKLWEEIKKNRELMEESKKMIQQLVERKESTQK
ncbi:MAG: hypothetical protein ACETVR_00465 [Candidatus Bathyarchaeia archaeon]